MEANHLTYFAHNQYGAAQEIQMGKEVREKSLDLEQTGLNPYSKHQGRLGDSQGVFWLEIFKIAEIPFKIP